jgi:hypothetical protein
MASTSLDRDVVAARPRLRGALLRLDGWTRIGPLAADRTWLLPLALAAYVLIMTWTWEFPDWRGVPFPPVWVATAGAGIMAWSWRRGAVTPVAAAAVVAVSAMVLTDVAALWTQPLRDIEIYLKAGDAWRAGAPPYMRVPLVEAPEDLSNYPFLYPPLTLPLFGALSALPLPLAVGIWISGSVALLVAGLRMVGVGWRWCLLLLLWPPVVQGLHVGNVAIPLFFLFAIAVRWPPALAIAPLFKIYSGIASLWLLRREHWAALVVGGLLVAALGLATLPLVGVELWRDWLVALGAYQVSQQILPNLYGFGLARNLPWLVVGAIGLIVAVLALRARERRDQLARLGVATVVSSPSLFSHGWLIALPAMFRLETRWFWLALGITSCAPGLAWFVALGIVIASWYVAALRRRSGDDPWHPLGAAPGPWPDSDGAAARPAAHTEERT